MADNKYDRQLRLWGHQGQRLLFESHTLLLGSRGPGIEGLKNLVLPGVGKITIWDDAIVNQADLGTNFFLESQSVGKYRAEETIRLLIQMNSDVNGFAVNQPISNLFQSAESALSPYTLIIANQLTEDQNNQLSRIGEKLSKPIIFINTSGFYGYVRNQSVVHEIFETKENKKYNLRIKQPFPALIEFVNQFDIEKLISDSTVEAKQQLAHIPYVILLVKALHESPNKTRKQAEQRIKEWKANISYEDSENFDQALQNAMKINLDDRKEIFQILQPILNHQYCLKANKDSSFFWVFAHTLREYIARYNDYPQSSQLPDMKSDTATYIALKKVYKLEHQQNKSKFVNILKEKFGQYLYEQSFLDILIENVMSLSISTMRPYYKELEEPNEFQEFQDNTPMIYVALRGAAQFQRINHRYANTKDLESLNQCIQEVRKKYFNTLLPIQDAVVRQVARGQGVELISISSVIGSVVAQEAIKLITHQFTPMQTGYFFNGVKTGGIQLDL